MATTSTTSRHFAPCANWARVLSGSTGDDYVVVAVPPASDLGRQGIRYAVQRLETAQARGFRVVTAPLPSATPKGEKQYEFNGYAGCVTQRTSRATGTLVGVYRADQAGIDADPEAPWAVVCESHNTILTVATLMLAKASTDPRDWCDDCRAAHGGGR